MTEHDKDTTGISVAALTTIQGEGKEEHPEKSDLVIDLSEMQELDVTSLALLLTAQRQAQKEDREVWLAGVPLHVWEALYGMGLGRFFRPFPVSRSVAV